MEANQRLGRLAEFLRGQEINTDMEGDYLVVYLPGLTVTVGCRPRPDDGGRWWFFKDASPLSEADQIVNASTALKGRLWPA